MIKTCFVFLLGTFFSLGGLDASIGGQKQPYNPQMDLIHKLSGDEAQTVFLQANALYKKGKFAQAKNLYEKIPHKSAFVHYNLGNCAYKLEQYGVALLSWRRAEKHWGFFNRDELIDNITLLKEKLRIIQGGEIKKRSPITLAFLKIKNLIVSSLQSLPLLIVQFIFLLLWLFLFLYIRFLYKKRKKVVICTLFGFIAFFGIILAGRYNIEAHRYGVITSRQAPLLSGPERTFQTLMNLHQAQEVVIKKESGAYYKIGVFGQTGWIHSDHIGVV